MMSEWCLLGIWHLYLVSTGVGSIVYALNDNDCLLKQYGEDNMVCVCNSDHCDYLLPEIKPNKVNIITSTQKGKRYLQTVQEFESSPSSDKVIVLNRNKTYQSIYGWGGALTDSVGINIKSLPTGAADHLMRSYFTGMGSMYNLIRIPMGGTDFSTHGYSYDDGDVDENLENFKLAPEDFEYKIPLMNIARNLSMNQLKFFTSTWTAPKWMKDNGKYTAGHLKKEFYQTWADYFLKFLEAYKKEGFDFWGISTGNEPSLAVLPLVEINSVGWNADSASLWIRDHLGPTLRNSEFKNIKIMAIDDQRYFFPTYASNVMENETTRNYIDGFGVHFYADYIVSSSVLTDTHNKFPDKFILATEASNGFVPFTKHVDIGSWKRGETYANDILEDLNNWVTGWVDWNLVLDLQGGPTYIKNYVDSPILVNATAGEFYKQPMYYAIGHFSKFIPEGSIRIDLSENNQGLSMVAVVRPEPDFKVVLVILNKNDEDKSVSFQDGTSYINLSLERKSITTVVF